MAGGRKNDVVPIFVPEWSKGDQSLQLELYSLDRSQTSIATEKRDGDSHDDESQITDEQKQGKHEHLLKSGPLGRCDDPFCTTCPYYFDYGSNLLSLRKQPRSTFFGEAKAACLRFFEWNKKITGIFNPHTKLVQRWNQVFAVSCLIAVFVDPLFFFIFSVKQTYFCIVFNEAFAKVVTALRSITDGMYFIHMLLQFRLAYFAPASRATRTGNLVDDPKTIAKHYLKGWFAIDVAAVLPVPQIMLWVAIKRYSKTGGEANFLKDLLRVVVLLQYIPKIIRFLPILFGRSQSGFIFETAWANFTINLFLYFLAGHVVGSCWYLFGLQRVNKCLQRTCNEESLICNRSFLDCGSGIPNVSLERGNWMSVSNASSNCLVNATFAYGIYNVAVPVALTGSTIHKYIYSLFWGFLQISTLGGNLIPSLFVGEVLFTMGVIGLGLLLFALLIGNMQNFLQSLGRR